MLSVSKYPASYIDTCRANIDSQIAVHTDLVAAARDLDAGKPRLAAAIEASDAVFFNNMVVVLDHYFCHRGRTIEGKDGNPLNEVRVLSNSLMENDGRMASDNTIRLTPEQSILKYAVGDEIRLDEAGYRRLSEGFLAEIAKKFA